MKGSYKKLRVTSIIILIFSFLTAIFLYFIFINSGLIFARIISKTTHTPVTIDTIHFQRHSFNIENLVIGNPKKAYIPTAFRAEHVEVDTHYNQYFKKNILIEKIEMNNIYINIEFYTEDKLEGNWQTLINAMETVDKSNLKGERQSHIKKLVLNNIQVTLILSDGKIHRLSPIKHLEFNDVTSDEGIPINEISEIIAQKMLYSIFKEEGLNLIIKIPFKVIKKLVPFLHD